MTGLLQTYLNLINIPLNFILAELRWDAPYFVWLAYQIIVTLAIIYYLYKGLAAIAKRVNRKLRGDRLVSKAEVEAVGQGADNSFARSLDAAGHFDKTVKELKAAKNYQGLGDAHAAVNKYKDAAKWYSKAGDKRKAAHMLARSGKTLKAAKLLLKEGDHVSAARFFSEKGKHEAAAKAHETGGNLAFAAESYGKARKYGEALRVYEEYFGATRDTVEQQVQVADACIKLLESDDAKKSLDEEQSRKLQRDVASRFEQAGRYEAAAKLFEAADDLKRAGEVYVLAGKLTEAAQCYKRAGREKEASQVLGRHHELRKQWREAALAYSAAGEYKRAAECYAKASEMLKAAECFERAELWYQAGVAYARAGHFREVIRTLQKMKEQDPNFDQSRALLGRAFYELHDYEHCAAALDNHLLGKRVEHGNKEYFYMLALAYEQLGKLESSREILYKIRTVDTSFRDVTQRISSISSRISMASGMDPTQSQTYRGSSEAASADRGTVEDQLGGRYKIERELGRGGMGVVYLARDTQLERPVALKFIGSLIDNSEEFRQRFIREAQAAAKITHPNIISIYDISASQGKSYIAMEYVEGQSLAHYLARKKQLTAREAINIIGQSCAALAAIHEAGIVHRDIKPDNILLGKGGVVKVTDFGLAKSENNRLTRTGTAMGTPSYMSPEQVLGKDADPRSDIYSIGLVLHEALTGKIVFAEGDVLERQLNETPPPPGQLVEGVPEDLDLITMKCIAKKPEERFASMRELLGALRSLSVPAS